MNGQKFSQIILIELFAIFQGLAFGILPALKPLLSNPDFHGLSPLEFRSLFVIFLVGSVFYALSAAWMSHRWKLSWVFLIGVISNLLSMLLMASTELFLFHHASTLGILYLSLLFLGGGLGFMMLALNRWTFSLFPTRPIMALLFLWAAVSFGMTVSGVFAEYSLALHQWWLAPGLIFGGFFVLFLFIDLFNNYPSIEETKGGGISFSILLYVIPPILYGYIEATIAVWVGVDVLNYDLYFIAFWAVATLARIFIGLTVSLLSVSVWYILLPLLLIVASFYAPTLRFLAAAAVSGLLPLNIGVVQQRFQGYQSLLTGGVLACYLFGFGLGGIAILTEETYWLLLSLSILLVVLHTISVMSDPKRRKQ